jgi:hypothetical protein
MSLADQGNPYQSPPEAALGSGGAAPSGRTTELLLQTKPWVRLFGILLCIGVGFLVIGAVVSLFMGFAGRNPATAGMGVGMATMYGVMALLYFFPARFLLRYASRIEEFAHEGSTERLNAALEAQKSFWKFVGITSTIVLIVYVGILVVLLIGTVVG